MKTHSTFIQDEISQLETKNLKRSLRQIVGPQGREISIDGKKVLNFCSNNYLGLADDPRLVSAAEESLRSEGFGSGASRLVCGNMSSHTKLEEAIARFKGVERCLVFTSGYMANVGIISALFGREDLIISDKLNHASILDGIVLSRSEHQRYPHNDLDALERSLKKGTDFRRRLIVTDSVFSMDGDTAPLKDIVLLARKYDAMVMVDEAHAFGVLGANGRGLAEHLGVDDGIDIQMGTLSKAAGAFGAYCCGSSSLIELVLNRARSFVYTTGMPPSVAAAGCQALEILAKESWRRVQLLKNTRKIRKGLTALGFEVSDDPTPIIPIVLKDAERCVEFSKRLMGLGIFVQAIRPPTVPVDTSRLRITVMATHTTEDIQCLLDAMRSVAQELAVI